VTTGHAFNVKAIAALSALRERLRNEELAPGGPDASVLPGHAETLDEVLAMTPAEFEDWRTFVQARRAVGDD
jgi:hypothetical protein